MHLRPNDEHGAATDRWEALENRWFNDAPILRLLGHAMFTLLLAALACAEIALFF